MKNNVRGHLSVLAANVIYGANYAIAKDLMLRFIPPFGFIVLRVAFSTLLFWLLDALMQNKPAEKKDIPVFIKFAVFGVAVNQLLFFSGLNLTKPINASLMMTANGVQVLLISALLFKIKISVQKITGIAFGIIGTATIILYGKSFAINSDTFLGDLFIFINSLSWAYYLVIAKPLLLKYHPATVMKWVFLFGNVMVIPFGYEQLLHVSWSAITFSGWWGIFFVVFGATFLAYLFNIYGLQHLESSVVSSYIYIQPAIAAIFSLLFGQGQPQWIHLPATALIFTGVYLVSRNEQHARM